MAAPHLPHKGNAVQKLTLPALQKLKGERDGMKMPVLFVGHGNPMNGLEDNIFSRTWADLGKTLPKPAAILCISAHWLTDGTYVTSMERPRTIHDFYGFPPSLYEVQYPAPGAPVQAGMTRSLLTRTTVMEDFAWGLDHGCWSVLNKMFPAADIPVYQLSIDYTQDPSFHFRLAQELRSLRNNGVLILGSGNIVHNLQRMQWREDAFDWALAFDNTVKEMLEKGDHDALVQYTKLGAEARLAVPTNEHYLPLLYAVAQQEDNDSVDFFNAVTTMGSVSMRSFILSGS